MYAHAATQDRKGWNRTGINMEKLTIGVNFYTHYLPAIATR